MVNTDDFIKRLEAILDYYSLTASLFADKLGIQRSGLSHLMSGRNKPSLDLVMKITENFSEVDLYWLLNGTGSFPKKMTSESEPPQSLSPAPVVPIETKGTILGDLFSQTEDNNEKTQPPLPHIKAASPGKKTERIVVFYTDGTFKEYFPEQ
ncbi:helix-turn-helix domain-containing protein [Flavobacterium sp.]|uniref:helix-turn-helix domain-containing protein n=1 Tax=Flavobacterium sp. TaxID=239 RepID=UPI004034CAFF